MAIKTCGCCGQKHTAMAWASLPLKGTVVTSDEEGTYSLELRNCACGSTIGIETVTK